MRGRGLVGVLLVGVLPCHPLGAASGPPSHLCGRLAPVGVVLALLDCFLASSSSSLLAICSCGPWCLKLRRRAIGDRSLNDALGASRGGRCLKRNVAAGMCASPKRYSVSRPPRCCGRSRANSSCLPWNVPCAAAWSCHSACCYNSVCAWITCSTAVVCVAIVGRHGPGRLARQTTLELLHQCHVRYDKKTFSWTNVIVHANQFAHSTRTGPRIRIA